MSFGNSWASCHTIDKNNKRNTPGNYNGCYSSGTMSYMLDSSSMVLYTVDKSYTGTDYELQPKINRQMFHYGEDKLVQGRLYPQSNDGNGSAYEPYRQVVQEMISTIFDFPNLWGLYKGYIAAGKYIISKGTHYTDYTRFDGCSLSKAKHTENNKSFVVGATPICIECGESHEKAESINCCHSGVKHICERCGCVIDDEEARWVGDCPYCEDCTTYCTICEELHVNDSGHEVDGYGWVCDDCLEYSFITCEKCGRVHYENDTVHIEDTDEYVCRDCAREYYDECKDCHYWFSKGSLNENHLCKECSVRRNFAISHF
jgi:hypothetical protein